MTGAGGGVMLLAVTRRRRPASDPNRHGGTQRPASRGGHLLAANRGRGLSPRQDLVRRAALFATLPKGHPHQDRPQFRQGTRGGTPK